MTTAQFYLAYICLFLNFIDEVRPKLCRLTQSQMGEIQREIQMCFKSNERAVTAHRMATVRRKQEDLLPKADLRAFKEKEKAKAKARIPQLLSMFSVITP